MRIGEKWKIFHGGTWRPAEVINELGNQIELKFEDAPDL